MLHNLGVFQPLIPESKFRLLHLNCKSHVLKLQVNLAASMLTGLCLQPPSPASFKLRYHSKAGGYAAAGQIITEESSFGRLAALRSLRFRSVFTMRSPEATAERSRNASWECMRENFDSFQEVAVNHPWVKVLR